MFHKGPSDKDVLQFFKIVSRHYKTDRPIVDCVEAYIKSTDNEEMRTVCKSIHRAMVNGSDFAPALEKAPKVFKPFIIQFIRVGEHNNQLDRFIEKIVNQLKQNISIRRKINGATLMPKISMTILFGAFLFLIYYLIPKIAAALTQIKIELPLITRALLSFGNFFSTFWWIVPVFIFLIIVYIRYRKEKYPVEYSLIGLRIPFYKDIAYYQIHYNFCEIFALCRESGLRSIESLKYTAMAIDNAYMSKILNNASVLMVRGASLPDAIRKSDIEHIISTEVIAMLETGETTNKTAEIMKTEAESYLEELDNVMETIGDKVSVAVLTPSYGMMLVFFGAVEYPLMQLTQNFGKLSRGIGQ